MRSAANLAPSAAQFLPSTIASAPTQSPPQKIRPLHPSLAAGTPPSHTAAQETSPAPHSPRPGSLHAQANKSRKPTCRPEMCIRDRHRIIPSGKRQPLRSGLGGRALWIFRIVGGSPAPTLSSYLQNDCPGMHTGIARLHRRSYCCGHGCFAVSVSILPVRAEINVREMSR